MGRRVKGTGSIHQRKDGKWVGRIEAGYTASGGRRRITVVASTRRECAARLRERQLERVQGIVGSTAPRFKDWADEWVKILRERVKLKTAVNRQGIIRRVWVPALGHMRVADIMPAHIRAVREELLARGLKTTTVSGYEAAVRQCLREAVENGYEVKQSVLVMRRLTRVPTDRRAMTANEARAILAEARKRRPGVDGARHDGSRWITAMVLGLRQSESLGLRWEDIDFDNRLITVRRQLARRLKGDGDIPRHQVAEPLEEPWFLTTPKTRRSERVLPMPDIVAEPLASWYKRCPVGPGNRHNLVWPNMRTGGPMGHGLDSKDWRHLQDKAGVAKEISEDGTIRRYAIHELRNTASTLMLEAGVPDAVILEMLGHTALQTTRGYMTVHDNLKRVAVASVANVL